MALTSSIKPGDWVGVKKEIQRLSKKLGFDSTPLFAGLTLTGLTANRLIWTDSSKVLASKDLIGLVAGTANRVTVSDDSSGGVTLSIPQDYHTGASPTLAGLTLTNTAVIGSDSVVFQPNADSTTFLQVLDADGGTPILNIDTTNERVGVGTATPNNLIQVAGLINFDDSNFGTFIGKDAFANDVGRFNIALGYQAGKNTDSSGAAGEGDTNVFIGYQAGLGSVGSISKENVAIGLQTLLVVTTGFRNVAIGTHSLYSTTTGNSNFGLGTNTLFANIGGSGNIAVGRNSQTSGISPDSNIALGNSTMFYNLTGGKNVVIGIEAGFGVLNQSYSNNTFIGRRSGFSISTGSGNIFIGYNSGYRQISNSNLLIIDTINRGSIAVEETNCLVYGMFSTTVTNQSLRFNVGDLTLASGTPYQTLWNTTHEDSDGGRESRLNFKGEQSGGEITTLARIEVGHDGTGDDQLGKIVQSVNTGAGLADAITLNSDLSASFTKIKLTAIGGYAVKLTNKTGANSVAGNLVKADTANNDAVVLTAATDDECFGVFLDAGIVDGNEAWVVTSGIADVLFDDNVAAVRGNWVGTGQAGLARTQAAPPALGVAAHFEEIGHSIESVVAGGAGTFILARCILQFN